MSGVSDVAYDEASTERDSARASRHHMSSYVCNPSQTAVTSASTASARITVS